jgi:hypothetical protein
VTDKDVWEKAKEGKFTGFSVEGYFQITATDRTIESEMMAQIFKALNDLSGTIKHSIIK